MNYQCPKCKSTKIKITVQAGMHSTATAQAMCENCTHDDLLLLFEPENQPKEIDWKDRAEKAEDKLKRIDDICAEWELSQSAQAAGYAAIREILQEG